MKKNKLLAFLLSAALIAQPVVYASANVNVNETGTAQQEETQDMADVDEMNSESDASMAATESESEVQGETSDEMNTNNGTEHQTDAAASEMNSESETGEVSDTEADGQMPEGMAVGGYIHSDLDDNTPVYYGSGSGRARAAVNIPAAYPADGIEGIQKTFPENRNQNPYGTCWAFSSLGLAEFDLISKGSWTSAADLSELQLAYFTFNFVQDPLGGTVNDTAQFYNENYKNTYLNYGGNYEFAMRRLGQWISPTDENNVPYTTENIKNVLDNGLSNQYAYNDNKAHLENAYLINIKENTKDVKQQIMGHGAVGVSYKHLDDGMTKATDYNAYYDTDSTGGGHAVMIVGWDDNFSKDKFNSKSERQPSKNGAWLIRNSWGSYYNYFWMSYETASLSDTAYAFDFSADDGYDNNYQLDGGLLSGNEIKFGDGTDVDVNKVVNYFTVDSKPGVKTESLEAVSLSFTHVANVSYTVEIYTDVTNRVRPQIYGTEHPEATTTGTTTYAGVYTIPLNNKVELKPGTTYAVVVTMDKEAMDYEGAISYKENPNSSSEDDYIWKCSVSANDGNSYFSYNNRTSFRTFGNNFRIKAFTSNNPYTITYELNGGTNDSSNPATCGSETIALKDPTREGCKFEGWYTDSKCTKDSCITEIPANASQDYTLYAKWAGETGETLAGYTVSMKGKSDLNFYMTLPETVTKDDDAYVEFTLPEGDIQTVKVKDITPNTNGYYVFTCGVPARQMASDIQARVVADKKFGKIYTYSVKEYSLSILNDTNNTYDEKTMNAVKAMLNYGAAAQVEFNYNTGNLANASLSEADKAISSANFEKYKYSIENSENVTGINYYGGTLSLRSGTCVKDYFILGDGKSIDDYTFRVVSDSEEVNLEPKQAVINDKECYYVEVDNIRAYDLDKMVTVVVRNKNQPNSTGMKVNYGPFSYAQAVSKSSSSDINLMKVINALYNYYEKAKAYVDGRTTQS